MTVLKNGVELASRDEAGALSNWDPTHLLAVGNAVDAVRPWVGEVYAVGVYDRALAVSEVNRNFLVGPNLLSGGFPVANSAPTVDAGTDRMIATPTAQISLRPNVEDDSFPLDQLTYSWEMVSGPAAVGFNSTAIPKATASFTQPGAYVLRLSVADGQAPTISDDLQVTVVDGAIPRLLEQATWGPTDELLERVSAIGAEAFVNEQLAAPPSDYPGPAGAWIIPVQMRFFHNTVHAEDQLRQRMTFAISKIFALNVNPIGAPYRMVPFLRLLHSRSLGNFYDLLLAVTLNPTMGEFLNMVNTAREFPGTPPPNENFARELAQLFTIGLHKLNPDGTLQMDDSGVPEAAFDEGFVKEMSRVFTGWTFPPFPGAANQWPNPLNFNGEMAAIEWVHNTDSKTLLDGFTIPGGQTARQDVEMALRHLFDHPNVGPFICKQLIQQLVTSHPTPAYVARVASVFNDNGRGVRGDLSAVAKAILLAPEAVQPAPSGGRLREPVLLISALLRALDAQVEDTNALFAYTKEMDQNLFVPSSVFSYFSPFHQIQDGALVGPEFEIHTGSNALDRANFVHSLTWNAIAPGVDVSLSRFETVAKDPQALADEVDEALFQGRMSAPLRQAILDASAATVSPGDRSRSAVYLAATSSEYQVQH